MVGNDEWRRCGAGEFTRTTNSEVLEAHATCSITVVGLHGARTSPLRVKVGIQVAPRRLSGSALYEFWKERPNWAEGASLTVLAVTRAL